MSQHLFGTDGIRGVPGEDPLDDATLYAIGAALGGHLAPSGSVGSGGAPPRILLGMDTRLSSPHIARQLAAGARSAGVEVAFAGVISTPGVACLVRRKGFDAGIVVSASHNPFTDNGVKLISGRGTKFSDEVESGLEREIFARRASAPSRGLGTREDVHLEVDTKLDEHYLEFLREFVLPGASLKGMKIVLDCANGAVSELGPALFQSLGADIFAIHRHPDGRNINAGCGSLHTECLRKAVVERGAQFGVAFDGDADRAIFSTASGQEVNGDVVLLAAARYMKAAGTLKGGAVVGTTMTNLGLERALEAEGLRLIRTAVGDRYVLEEMLRIGANLGGEQSGHIIFLDHSITGDGLLTAVIIASLVALKGPLETLATGLAVYPQKILNVVVRDKRKPLESIPGIANALAQANAALDGRGRVVLRYSGTEPLARVMVEAERAEDVERFSDSIASAVRSAIGA